MLVTFWKQEAGRGMLCMLILAGSQHEATTANKGTSDGFFAFRKQEIGVWYTGNSFCELK